MMTPARAMLVAGALLLVALAVIATSLRLVVRPRPVHPPGAASNFGSTGLADSRLARVPAKVTDGVYILGDMIPSAVYVVETSEGLALIDSGLEEEHDKLVQGLSRLGLDAGRVKMILLTHAHGDHTMGAGKLRDETGCQVYIGAGDAGPVREGGPYEAIFSKFDMPGTRMHPITIDGELEDGQIFTLGDARITAIATPGHTPGSFCYLLAHRGHRVFFAGDTITTLSSGLGTYSAYLPPKYRGDAADYLRSLEKLRSLPGPDFVLPGHPWGEMRQSPRLGESHWHALLDRGIEELQRLTERYARDGADFLDGTAKQLAEGVFYLGDCEGRTAYALVLDECCLLFDAVRGERPDEFVAAAWQELGLAPPAISAVLLTSCQADNVSGLGRLAAATGCRVVVSPVGVETARRLCPDETEVLSIEELATLPCEGLEAFAAPGRDDTAAVYHFSAGDAQVLISADIPIEVMGTDLSDLFQELRNEVWEVDQFSSSLANLRAIRPNLWLSAWPRYGRNANLYDDYWLQTMLRNEQLLRRYRLMKNAPER